MRSIIVPVLFASLLPLGCTKDPEQPQPVAPASTAAGPAQSGEVPTEKLDSPAIVAAQIGYELGGNGLLANSAASIPAGQAVHGLAIFRGPDGASGKAGLQVFGNGDELLYTETKPYTVEQGASVGFDVSATQQLSAGHYKAIFLCDGGPCWEVQFDVE